MNDQSPLVRIEGMSKHFGKTVALDNLTLNIARGEFVTFLGPSGCGKSTTLRILGGFERPTTGKVFLDGVDVTYQPAEKRHVNMVFQDYALFPHMTVAGNIAFGLELKGMGKAEIRRRSDEIMSFLELGDFGGRYPAQLSGGQRQRVALARALAPDPALLLLDEPLGALDAKLRGQVQQELKSIQRRTSKTFLFVTHDQEEALTMSDRIVVMNRGRVEQDGTRKSCISSPPAASWRNSSARRTCFQARCASARVPRSRWSGRERRCLAPRAVACRPLASRSPPRSGWRSWTFMPPSPRRRMP